MSTTSFLLGERGGGPHTGHTYVAFIGGKNTHRALLVRGKITHGVGGIYTPHSGGRLEKTVAPRGG